MYVLPPLTNTVGHFAADVTRYQWAAYPLWFRRERMLAIIREWLAGATQAQIAKKHGVTPPTVYFVVRDGPTKLRELANVRGDDGYDLIADWFPGAIIDSTVDGAVYLRLHTSPKGRFLVLRNSELSAHVCYHYYPHANRRLWRPIKGS